MNCGITSEHKELTDHLNGFDFCVKVSETRLHDGHIIFYATSLSFTFSSSSSFLHNLNRSLPRGSDNSSATLLLPHSLCFYLFFQTPIYNPQTTTQQFETLADSAI